MSMTASRIAKVRTAAQTLAGLIVTGGVALLNERYGWSLADIVGADTATAVYGAVVPLVAVGIMAAADRWPILQRLFLVVAVPFYADPDTDTDNAGTTGG